MLSKPLVSLEERLNIANSTDGILDLRDELVLAAERFDKSTLRAATTVEHLMVGRPIPDWTSYYRLAYQSETNTSAPQNIMSNLILSWSALITQDRPSVYAVPTKADPFSTSAASIATKFIEYFESEEETASKWDQSALYAAQHGTGMMRIYYDYETDRVEWKTTSIFETFLQKAPSPDKVQYCVYIDYIDQYSAEERILAVNPEYTGIPATKIYYDAAGFQCEGVPMYTIYYKPCARYPTGLIASVIDDTVLDSRVYDLVFPNADGSGTTALLPVVWWTARSLRNSTLGTSWSFDVTPIQQSLDILNDKLLKTAQQSKQFLVMPKSLNINEGFLNDNYLLSVDDAISAPLANAMGYINPANLDPNMINERQNLINQMYDTSGVTPATAGNASKDASGKALAYQAQLDTQKHASSRKSLDNAIAAAWDLTLKLVQTFYTVPRRMQLSEGESEFAFVGADISGVDVRLEPRSSTQSQYSQKVLDAQNALAQGVGTPEDLASLKNFTRPEYAAAKATADDLITRFLSDQPVDDQELNPQVLPSEIFLEVLDKYIDHATLTKDMENLRALNALKSKYYQIIMGKSSAASAPPASNPSAPPSDISAPLPETTQDESSYKSEPGLYG